MARAIIPNYSCMTYVAPGHQYHYPLWFVIHSYRGPGLSMQPSTVGQQMWWLWPQAINNTTHCGSLYLVTVASIKWQQTPLSMARAIIPSDSCMTYVAPGHQYHYPLWFIIHSYRGPGPSMPPHMVYLQCIFNDFYLSLHPVTSFCFLGSHGRHAHLSFWVFLGEALQNISIKCINKMTTNAFIYGQGHHSQLFLYDICGPGPSIPLPIVVHYT